MTELTVTVPAEPVRVGDRFDLVVGGELPEGPLGLAVEELSSGLLAGEARTEVKESGTTLVLPLRAVGEGRQQIAGLALVVGEERLALPDAEVEVVLGLPEGAVAQVAPPLPPLRLEAPLPLWFWPLLVLLALAGLLALRHALKQKPPPPPPPARPPDLVAAEALAALRSRLPRTPDEVPAFVVEVSDILRRYVEAVFGLDAPERTSEEVLAELSAHPQLLRQRAALERFLAQCDMVKFAGLRPAPAQALPLLDAAESFVEETRGHLSAALPAPAPA